MQNERARANSYKLFLVDFVYRNVPFNVELSVGAAISLSFDSFSILTLFFFLFLFISNLKMYTYIGFSVMLYLEISVVVFILSYCSAESTAARAAVFLAVFESCRKSLVCLFPDFVHRNFAC